MTWDLIEFTTSYVEMQLNFEYATFISYEEADTLVVEFADPDLFISGNGIKMLPEHRRLTRPLMRQLPDYAKPTQMNINSSAKDSKTITTVILAGNIVMGAGQLNILEMINVTLITLSLRIKLQCEIYHLKMITI